MKRVFFTKEQLHAMGEAVVIVDPKSAWYGTFCLIRTRASNHCLVQNVANGEERLFEHEQLILLEWGDE